MNSRSQSLEQNVSSIFSKQDGFRGMSLSSLVTAKKSKKFRVTQFNNHQKWAVNSVIVNNTTSPTKLFDQGEVRHKKFWNQKSASQRIEEWTTQEIYRPTKMEMVKLQNEGFNLLKDV